MRCQKIYRFPIVVHVGFALQEAGTKISHLPQVRGFKYAVLKVVALRQGI